MSNFTYVKIDDIGDVITGRTPKTNNVSNYGSDYMFIGPTDLHKHFFITESERMVTKQGFDSIKSSTLNGTSVLVGCIGWDMGNVGIVDAACVTNQQINSITNIKDSYNPYYIYYWLKTKKDFLFSQATVTRTPILNKSTFSNIEIYIPSERSSQDGLVEILIAIDKKIDLNNQINAELEAMTKTLYDYWFVQFDFPDAEGKPYKSSGGKMVYSKALNREIPEDWNAKPLLDITSVSNDSIDPAKNSEMIFKLYSIPVFDVTSSYSIEKATSIGSNKFTVEELDLLVSKLNPWFNRVIYALDLQDQICSTEFVVWRCPNLAIKNFMYLIATSDQFVAHCTQAAIGTSNSHKRVNPNVMMSFIQPFDRKIAEQFGESIDPMIKTIMVNRKENLQLERLRDWLLPMLMNGQVTVN